MNKNWLKAFSISSLVFITVAVITGLFFLRSSTTRTKASIPSIPDYGTYPIIYARDDYNNLNPQDTYGTQTVGPVGGHIRKPFSTVTSAEIARYLNAGQTMTLFGGEAVERPYMLTVSIYDYLYSNTLPVNERFISYFPDSYNEQISVPECGVVAVPKYESQELKDLYKQKIEQLAEAFVPYKNSTIKLRDHPNLAGIFISSGFEDETTPAKDWNHSGPRCNVLTKWKELHPDNTKYTEWIKFQMTAWRNAFPTKTIVIQPGAAEGDKMRAQLRDFALSLNPPVGIKHNGMQIENLGYSSWISSSTNYMKLRGGQVQVLDSVTDAFNPAARALTAMETTLSLSAYGDTAKKRSEFLYWSFLASLRANVHFVDLQDDWIYPQSIFHNKSPIEVAGEDEYAPWPGNGNLSFWKWYYENLGVSASNAKHAWVVFRDSEFRFTQSGGQSTSVPVVMREKTYTGANAAGHGIQKGYPPYSSNPCSSSPEDPYCDPSSDPQNYPSKLDGNFNKYLKVLEPDPTELVLWNDPQIVYPQGISPQEGQKYTRQMKKLPANKKLLLQLDRRLTSETGLFSNQNTTIHIFFLNVGVDYFDIKYRSKNGQITSKRIQKGPQSGLQNNGLNAVLHKELMLEDADFSQYIEGNATLVIENDNGDDFFHMVWLESSRSGTALSTAQSSVSHNPSITEEPIITTIQSSPSPNPSVTQQLLPTIYPSPSPTTYLNQPTTRTVSLSMTVKLQGISDHAVPRRKVVPFRLIIDGEQTIYTDKNIDFAYDQAGIWKTNTLITIPIDHDIMYRLSLKGPLHLRRKICETNPTDTQQGLYKCDGKTGIKFLQENTFDLTKILLYAGDIKEANGIIDAYDLSIIRADLGKNDFETLLRSDINFDGIVDTQDFSIVLNNLSFQIKFDE